MADPIGFYNSKYTGEDIDAAVGQIENKTDAPTGSTIMQRDTNGRAQIEAGTSGKEIVNFAQFQAAIESTTNNINHLNGIVAQQSTTLNELQAAIKPIFRHHLKITAQYEHGFYIDFISSSDTRITSLEALLGLSSTIGEIVPAYGTAGEGSSEMAVNYATLNSEGGITGMSTFPKIATIKWTNFVSLAITDTVTEI